MTTDARSSKDPALLLKLLREKKKAADGGAAEAPETIPRRTEAGPAPLSFGQERLWLLDRLTPGGSSFNMPFPLRLRGELDSALLERALAALVARHDSLRTTFRLAGEQPVQVVAPPGGFALALIDLGDLPEGEREEAARRRIGELGRHSFDLETGPLFRADLIRLHPRHHLLMLNLHHIISDGWSTGVLFTELRELLAAELARRPSALPAPALQYADFAVWQRDQLRGERIERQLAYWRERLEEAAPNLGLPTDRPRPPRTGDRNGSLDLSLDEAAARGLRALATRHGASLFMVLLAAFKLLLHRLSGQEDVLVGSPIAGRQRRETEGLVGYFLNTLVLRTQVGPQLTFRQLLLAVRETVLGATANQDLPFEKLLIELQPERQLSQTPFFQVFFNMANIPDLEFELPGLEVEMMKIPEVGSKFDLNLYVFGSDAELELNLVYNPDLFDRARMREMLAQFRQILEQASADPELPVGAFDLVTPGARERLPDPRLPLPGGWPGSVTDLFLERAAGQPQAIALEDGQVARSYGELRGRVDGLAARLAAAGVERGEVVAIWAHRSALLPEALLGILRRGAAFMILDPGYPPRRLADFLELARPRAIVLLEGAPPVPAEVEALLPALRLPLLRQDAEAPAGFDPGAPLGPGELAYYAFTSGSTGKPKAILGAHGSLTAFLPFVARRFGLGPGDRQSLVSALSHDPLQRDVFVSLCLGMTLVAPDPELLGSPGYLASWARERRLTVMNLVPAMLQLLCQEAPGEGSLLPDLRRVFTVGEVLKRADVERLHALAPNAVCVNLYGATETQRALSFLELPRDFAFDSEDEQGPDPGSRGLQKAALPLGRGMEGADLLVLGARQALAGVGELGEIVFRSRHLAIGYADPEQTREKFAVNPFTGDAHDRLYKTGDLGRFLPSGGVEFAGRTDFQVKIRGFRIELQEIEAALRRHPALSEAVVVLRTDGEGAGEPRLVGYFTGHPEAAAPAARELRELLLATLPDYMVPSAFVPLAAFPLNRAGKIDRLALPAPAAETRLEARRPPATPEEEVLAAIFGQLLGKSGICRDDHFFELGGHSLLATQLLARARDAFGVALPLRAVFEKPTLEALAAAFRQALAGGSGRAPEPPLEPLAEGEPRPLSFAQERVYFIEKLDPGQGAYVLSAALRLRGALDPAVLAAAFGRIVLRHEALRTRFVEVEGVPHQLVDPPDLHDLPLVDLAELPAAERDAAVASRAAAFSNAGFDLARDPMLRTVLLRLGAAEHVLLLAIHHIVADGWSLGILVDELRQLYHAFAAGLPDPLPPLAVQYADVAAWQRRRLAGETLEQGLAFWRAHLAGAPQLLALPTDAPRPAVQTFAGDSIELELGEDLYLELKRFGAAGGFTPFMVLMAAFASLMGRFSGQDEVVIGTPIASRQRSELEGLIGFFANTLALRTDLGGRPDFLTLCRRVREAALGAYAHQEIPFERLVAELAVERDLGHSPVFQVMLALQNVPAAQVELGSLEIAALDQGRRQALFDLSLVLVEYPGGLLARLEYNTDLFLRATAEGLARSFERLLRGALAAPSRPVESLDLIGAEERRRLLATGGAAPLVATGGLAARWLRQAEAHPENLAVVDGERQLTYGELGRQCRALAARLRQLGVRRGDAVAILAERSLEAVAAQLAILSAGAFFVPLHPSLPEARLRFILGDLGCAALFAKNTGELPGFGLPTIDLATAIDFDLPSTVTDGETPWAHPDELAYAIYTSGSTGTPKGVGGRHGAVLALLADLDARLPIAPGTRCAWTAGPHFDVSIGEVFGALARGGTLVIAADAARSGADLYAGWLAGQRVAVAEMPAPYLAELLALVRAGRAVDLRLAAMTVGTEPIPHPLLAELRKSLPETRILNFYGPTETTVECTVFEVEAGEVRPGKTPIGRPLRGVQAYVVDRHGELVPPGVFGELWIGGPGLARGYLGRPGLTAERFLPDPFAPTQAPDAAGARVYRTGDLVRQLPSGDLEFAGRLDDQLKIRGFRVEPGEIEAALASHPAVRDQLVLAQPGPGQLPILVAYAALGAEATDFDAAALRRHLESRLPDYLIPGAFVLLEELPRTTAGKVDKKALPAWRPSAKSSRRAADPLEELLAGVFAEVLALEEAPGVEDDFFHLGGHSLLATRLVARIRQRIGVELPLREIFLRPTVALLAPRLAELRVAGHAPELPPLEHRPLAPGEAREASFGEQRMWFLQRFEPGSAAYHLRSSLHLRGDLDESAFEHALREIVRRHQVLRSTYQQVDGRLEVRVAPPRPVVLDRAELSSLPAAEREAALAALLAAEARAPFDLEEGPLFRFRLVHLAADHHLFLAAFHHAIFDGWSHQLLMRELETLYEAFRQGRPSPLPEPALQYGDYARWQRGWLAGEELERQLAFWRRNLSDEPLELPTENGRPEVLTRRGEALPWRMPADLAVLVREWLGRESQTAYMTLAGAWQAYLAALAGQDAVSLGSPIAGRRRQELEEVIGFFANTLVLRTDLSGNPTFREALERVKEAALDAFAHQDVPFEKLLESLGVVRDTSRNPLFQAGFQVLDRAFAGERLAGLEIEPLAAPIETSRFDLDLQLFDDGSSYAGALVFNPDLFSRERVAAWLDGFAVFLAAGFGDPRRRLADLPLMPEATAARLLALPAAAQLDTAESVSGVDGLFFRQAASRPEAPAIAFAGTALSYGELARRAESLAGLLLERGVAAEDRIGVLVERGLDLPVALLAVLRAGAAYVPLDPAYPAERLRYMAEAAGCRLVLTHGAAAAAGLPEAVALLDLGLLDWRQLAQRPAPVAPARHAESLAYVLFTSGSTGKPKGVMVTHGNLENFVLSMAESPGCGPDDVMVSVTTMSFDIFGLELYLPLATGAKVELASRETAADGAALAALMRASSATLLQATPATWRLLLASGWTGEPGLRALCGGEALPAELAGRLLELVGELWNVYGPTETTIWSALRAVGAGDRSAVVPLGAAIANTGLYVVDRHGRLLPPGQPGELWIGGAGVARGYIGRADLSAERFVPDPFAGAGARAYRTGDLVRRRPHDLDLEFLGRIDHQVKVRGFRIELGEIEAALATHPAIAQALLLARDEGAVGTRLVAYWTLRPGHPGATAGELQDHLRAQLPEYMVPSAFVSLDAFPLTPNGKVDRKALPAWQPEESPREERRAASPLEELLAGLFAELLGLAASPGLAADFFRLGGHSLLATALAARIRERLGVELPLRAIFLQPTVAGLAAQVAELRGAGESRRLPALERRPLAPGEEREASFGEQRMFFLQSFYDESTVYDLRAGFELRGPLDVSAFERALGEIVWRHQVLRSTYHQHGADLRVRLESPPSQVLAFHDLGGLEPRERDEAVAALLAEEASRPFDLARGPLFRFHLVRLEDQRHLFLRAVHHAAFDGSSHRVVMGELAALYEAFRHGRPSPLAEPALQYSDFAAWQRRWLKDEELERQLAFWRHVLGGAEPLALPTEGPRPEVFTHRGEAVAWQLPEAADVTLRELLRRQGLTSYMALAGAWQAYLAALAGQDAVSLGSPIAGRRLRELEGLVGFFANTLVLRTDLSGNPTFRAALERTKEAALDAFAHQDVPFEKLVDSLGAARDASRNPLFQAGFQVLDAAFAGETLTGLEVENLPAPILHSRFDLDLQLFDDGRSFSGALIFNPDLFSRRRVQGWLDGFEAFLAAGLADPERRLAELPLLPPGDAARLLALPRAAEVPFELLDEGVDRLFFAQAARRPEATALGFAGAELSYGELARRADALARILRQRGVAAEDRVGVLLERGLELPLALLAVLRANAAYVPLDPSYPADRLRYMTEAAGCRILLTRDGLEVPLALGQEVAILDLSALDLAAANAPEPPAPLAERHAESLAYVLFTSGSTGKPKGVMIGHGALANFVRSMARIPGCGPGDVLVSVTTVSFDIFGLELYLPLATGAKVELASREIAADGEALAALIASAGATLVQATPATWRLLLGAGWAGRPGLRALCGGEALPAELAQRLLERVGELWNVYGPTETTIWSALRAVAATENAPVVPLGDPIANTFLYVVDRHGRLLPPGEPGELWIGGSGLARGYIGRPDLSAERFVPDPFAPGTGARAYRTGDLVRRRPEDLELEFLGRIDHQVKVRGFRIELGEIEAALAAHPAIGQAVVAARQDGPGGVRLVAYWTPRPAAGELQGTGAAPLPAAADLQAHLREGLPDYMVPPFVMRLEAFPLTPNGKVDRKALPAPERAAESVRRPPVTPIERTLATIWQDLLKTGPIFLDDDFFLLGGDSIVVIHAVAKLREAGWSVKTRDYFATRSLEELAAIAVPTSETAQPALEAAPEAAGGIDVGLVGGDLDLDDLFGG